MANTTNALPQRNRQLVNRKFTEFFFPSVLMSASLSLSLIIDSALVGNLLGSTELGAVNLVTPLVLFLTAISNLFGIGASIVISTSKGQMDDARADRALTIACMAWAVLSVIGLITGLVAYEPVAGFLSGGGANQALVAQYLRAYLPGAPLIFYMLIFPGIIRADGQPQLASVILVVANAVNLVLDYVFMKFCGLGLFGAALATITGYGVGAVMFILYLRSPARTIHITRVTKADLAILVDMFKVSISSIFGQALMFAKMLIINRIITRTAGSAGLASYSVCMSCLSLVSTFIAGAAQTTMPMVGAFRGAHDSTAIRYTIQRALRITLGCAITLSIVFELIPVQILALYGVKDPEVLSTGIAAVRLFSICLTGIAFNFLYMYYLQARKFTTFSMQICAIEGFLLIVPLCIGLSRVFGVNGIWIAYDINAALVALFVVLRARHEERRSHGTLHSLYLLEEEREDTVETTIDVTGESGLADAAAQLAAQTACVDADTLQDILMLSHKAYAAGGRKGGAPVDIIVTPDSISIKDLGKSYDQIDSADLIQHIKARQDRYEHVLMIGMNYSAIDSKTDDKQDNQ